MLRLTKLPPPFGGVFTFYYTSHIMKRFIPHVHRARPLNGFDNGSNLAENTIEYVLLTSLRWKFHLFLSEACSARKSYRYMGLRNGIILGIRKTHIRFGNRFDWVGGLSFVRLAAHQKMQFQAFLAILLILLHSLVESGGVRGL